MGHFWPLNNSVRHHYFCSSLQINPFVQKVSYAHYEVLYRLYRGRIFSKFENELVPNWEQASSQLVPSLTKNTASDHITWLTTFLGLISSKKFCFHQNVFFKRSLLVYANMNVTFIFLFPPPFFPFLNAILK